MAWMAHNLITDWSHGQLLVWQNIRIYGVKGPGKKYSFIFQSLKSKKLKINENFPNANFGAYGCTLLKNQGEPPLSQKGGIISPTGRKRGPIPLFILLKFWFRFRLNIYLD